MPLIFFYTMVQKSQKWPKTQIKGGPALKENWTEKVRLRWSIFWWQEPTSKESACCQKTNVEFVFKKLFLIFALRCLLWPHPRFDKIGLPWLQTDWKTSHLSVSLSLSFSRSLQLFFTGESRRGSPPQSDNTRRSIFLQERKDRA